MAKGKRGIKSEGTTNETRSSTKAVNQVLDILHGYDAAEQNEIVTGVISELRVSRLSLVKHNQDELTGSQSAISSLDSAVQAGLQAQIPNPEA